MKKWLMAAVVLVAMTLCMSTASAVTEAEIEASIEAGLTWLAGQQIYPGDGSWPAGYSKVGITSLAVKKFEHYAITHDTLPLDPNYRFYNQVKYGLNYIFSQAVVFDLTGDPNDSDSDNIGITFGDLRGYETGIALMAIAESNCPDSIVDAPAIPEIHGVTYRELAVDIMDYLAYHQNSSGGWGYQATDTPDQSVTGYAVLGLAYASEPAPHGFGLTIPATVLTRLNSWIAGIQCNTPGVDFGGSGYLLSGPCYWVNCLKTGNLLFELALENRSSGDPAVDNAIQYLVNTWTDPSADPGWQNHAQAAYCIMKGLEFQGITGMLPNSAIDWYDDLASHLVAIQVLPAGNWPADYWGNSTVLATAWALLTLERAAPSFGCDDIRIEKTHNTHQGQYETVSITIENSDLEMGGFDFLIAYDASALALPEATPGQLLEDCGWEYFTYRHGVHGNCGDACPSGLLRIFAIAETNNGPNHPSCYGPPDTDPHELVGIRFLVTNDRTFECQYVPIYFFWDDCGDNSVSSVDGEIMYVDRAIYDFEGNLIWDEDDDDEYPEDERIPFVGAPDYCLNPDPEKPTAVRFLCFYNGGIDIICADSIDDRGDINLNGTANEIADAVLFSNYFVHGISVFNVNIDGQIAASDVNADGITLSVADLVYLIRIITGDAPPYPKLSPVTVKADLVDGVLSVNADMGAAYVVIENSVTPLLLAESMEMKYQYDENNNLTRILVYSMEPDRRFSGDFLGGINGNVITLEMATYDGAPVTTKLVPDGFTLYPCYPNPFNPVTTISFALAAPVDYELVIYNALGQKVQTFSGHSGPGLERLDWDASAHSSGVYFYRLTADDFSDTKKMVLLK